MFPRETLLALRTISVPAVRRPRTSSKLFPPIDNAEDTLPILLAKSADDTAKEFDLLLELKSLPLVWIYSILIFLFFLNSWKSSSSYLKLWAIIFSGGDLLLFKYKHILEAETPK